MKKPGASPAAPIIAVGYQVGILVLLGGLLFLPSLGYEFVGLDDTLLLADNAAYLSRLSNVVDAFKHDVFYNPVSAREQANVYYRPILTISFMVSSALGGQEPFIHHLMNILLHITNGLLVLYLFRRLAIPPLAAFWGALVFTVHPLLSQAVAWIPGRNDSLLALFVLLSILSWLRFVETLKTKFLLLHVLFFALGLFTKETAIATPLIAFACYWVYARKEPHSARLWWALPLYALVLATWLGLRAPVVAQSSADLSPATLAGTFLRNSPVYFQILQKVLFPLNLSLLSTPQDTHYGLALTAVLAIGTLLLISRHVSWSRVLFGFLWFNAFLLPVFLVHILTGFEHRVYLPLVGFLILLIETDLVKRLSLQPAWPLFSCAAFLVLLFAANCFHVRAFSNGFSFWEKAATNSPHSSLAKLNYGVRLAEQGKLQEALAVYQEGLRVNPAEPKLHNNIAIIYARTGHRELAEREFRKEIELHPDYSDTYYNLGVLYGEMGDRVRMVDLWRKTLELDPRHERARAALDRLTAQQR